MTHFSSLNRVGPLAALLLVGISLTVHAQTITMFDVPNSTRTVPQATNLLGQVTGNYPDANGLLRLPPGAERHVYLVRSCPECCGDPTIVTDINFFGQIIGLRIKTKGGYPGFFRQSDGTIVYSPLVYNVTPHQEQRVSQGQAFAQLTTTVVDGAGPIAINAFGQTTGGVGQGQYGLPAKSGRDWYRVPCGPGRGAIYHSTSHKPVRPGRRLSTICGVRTVSCVNQTGQ